MAITPYMSLDLPVPTVTLGPEWAEQLNAALEFIDAHDHTAGKGRLITSAALNINDDVALNNHNLTLARSYNMANLTSPIALPADLRSLYAVNGELYFNDGDGNQIQITDAGGLNASTIGGIGGDYGPPAAVNYSSISKSYIFYQNSTSGLRGKLDSADILLRDDVVGANAITLKSPTSLAAAYDFRFPNALPGSTQPLLISSAGDVDPGTITEAMVTPLTLTDASIQDASITNVKFAPTQVVTGMVKETFLASGTWTRPAGVDVAIFKVVGAGGGGGGGGGYAATGPEIGAGGGGGGAAGQVILQAYSVAQSSYTITVGTAGAGGAKGTQLVDGFSGGSGTDSIVSAADVSITARGGVGGGGGQQGGLGGGGTRFDGFTSLTTMTYRAAGGASGATPGNAGSNGSAGESSPYATGGAVSTGGAAGASGAGGGGGGGAACIGDGGSGGNAGNSGSPSAGGAGAGYGSGGGGGGGATNTIAPSNDSTAGGAAAPGIVEVYYAAPNL